MNQFKNIENVIFSFDILFNLLLPGKHLAAQDAGTKCIQ